MNIVDKILVDPITRGLKFFTKGGVPAYITQVRGRTDGSAVPAGEVGETKTWTSAPANQALTTTETDWTNATFTLGSGVWLIVGKICMTYFSGTTAGNQGYATFRLTDGTNNVVDNCIGFMSSPYSSGTYPGHIRVQSPFFTIQNVLPATTTTYKIRAYRFDNAGTGSADIENTGITRSTFFAIRIA
jgi:hypothetical protein